jgi:hypothetical protein
MHGRMHTLVRLKGVSKVQLFSLRIDIQDKDWETYEVLQKYPNW